MSNIIALLREAAYTGGRSKSITVGEEKAADEIFDQMDQTVKIQNDGAGAQFDLARFKVRDTCNTLASRNYINKLKKSMSVGEQGAEEENWVIGVVLIILCYFPGTISVDEEIAMPVNAPDIVDDAFFASLKANFKDMMGAAVATLCICFAMLVKKSSKIIVRGDYDLIRNMVAVSGTSIHQSLAGSVITKLVEAINPKETVVVIGRNLDEMPNIIKYRISQAPTLSVISAIKAAFDLVPNLRFWEIVDGEIIGKKLFIEEFSAMNLIDKVAFTEHAKMFGVQPKTFDKSKWANILVMTHVIGRDNRGSLEKCINAQRAFRENSAVAIMSDALFRKYKEDKVRIISGNVHFGNDNWEEEEETDDDTNSNNNNDEGNNNNDNN